MKTLISAMILSVVFLSAGAERGVNRQTAAVPAKPGNVTEIAKNQAWPLAGSISVEPCALRRCIGV